MSSSSRHPAQKQSSRAAPDQTSCVGLLLLAGSCLFLWCLLSNSGTTKRISIGGRNLLAQRARPTFSAGDNDTLHALKFVLPNAQSIPLAAKPLDPFALSIHHTRYYAGCFNPKSWGGTNSPLAPWVLNFDYLITGCGVNWLSPGESDPGSTCLYTWADKQHPEKLYAADTRPWRLKRDPGILTVHVHADYRHFSYFMDSVLPVLERHTELGVFLHTGGGDSEPPGFEHAFSKKLLASRLVKRWVIEQSRDENFLIGVSKIRNLPTGICEREIDGENGASLVFAMEHTADDTRRQLSLMTAMNEHVKPWHLRKDRVLFCFGGTGPTGRPSRIEWHGYAVNGTSGEGCSVCDVCHHRNGSLSHAALWKLYGEYKYIASPYGNGADCGRTWEILLLGAVPVIEYWAGATGYNKGLGNDSAILVRNVTEINSKNLTEWSQKNTHGVDRHKLSHEYWSRLMFEMDTPEYGS